MTYKFKVPRTYNEERINQKKKKKITNRNYKKLTNPYAKIDHLRKCLTLCHPFLQESPTIFAPFLKICLSSAALSFT